MNDIKNLIIVNDYGYVNGGAAQVAISEAVEFSRMGYNVTFFSAVGPICDELKHYVKTCICLNQYDILTNPSRKGAVFSGIWNQKAYQELKKLLATTSPKSSVIHIHGWSKALSSSIIACANRYGYTPFITMHDYFSICPNGGFYNYQAHAICKKKPMRIDCVLCNCDSRSYFQKGWRVARQFMQDRYVRNNKKIIPVYISEFSKSHIAPYLKAKESYMVFNPIDIRRPEKHVKAFRNEYFLYIGRISPEKGVELFCSAVTQLGLKAIVVGDGVERKKLEKVYRSVHFVGWKSKMELLEYINKARALVFPSKWYEGAPLTIPEVLLQGVPCIVPDNCAASDYITDGFNGLIFQIGNESSLKDCINKLNQCDEDSDIFCPIGWDLSFADNRSHATRLITVYENMINEVKK